MDATTSRLWTLGETDGMGERCPALLSLKDSSNPLNWRKDMKDIWPFKWGMASVPPACQDARTPMPSTLFRGPTRTTGAVSTSKPLSIQRVEAQRCLSVSTSTTIRCRHRQDVHWSLCFMVTQAMPKTSWSTQNSMRLPKNLASPCVTPKAAQMGLETPFSMLGMTFNKTKMSTTWDSFWP